MAEIRLVSLVFGFLLALAVAAPFDDEKEKLPKVCPRIISRAEWKAREPKSSVRLTYSPTPYVVVHHGGIGRYCHDQKTCSEIVRSYQNLHLDERGWFDIGYQFVIGEDGNVYEGRGWDLVGAHAPGYNTQSIGICIIGDFTNFMPNEAALKALRSLMKCGVALGKVREDFHVIGHRQVRSTECPGETFFKYVQSMPNWSSSPIPITTNQSTNVTYQSY